MPRKPAKSMRTLRDWHITLVRTKGQYLGQVEAPDAEAAIKAAIERFNITDPQQQRRLVVAELERH